MPAYYLGLDAGTSGLKALLIDERGATVGQGTSAYALHTPRPGWVESDPDEWWHALCAATRRALAAAGIDGAQVAAVGFSGQMHTLVLLDERYRPVRPAISWADARGAEECAEIERRVGRARLIATTGSPAVPAFTSAKLLWVRRHEPEVWARARTALLAKDYLRLRLTGGGRARAHVHGTIATGMVASDPTDAGATGLLDLRARDWSAAVLDALELPRTLLPPLVPSAAVAGTVTVGAAAETGLRAGTPVAAGAGDQECAALGCGLSAPGPLLVTVGTGGQIFAVTDAPRADPAGRLHALPHALPDRWHLLAAIPAAGLALSWLREMLPHTAGRAAPSPPIFFPAVAGERTPSMDGGARAAFVGLDLTHTADDLLFAAREGVAFALRRCVEVLEELGVPTEPVLVTGGLSADSGFLALLADALDRPLAAAAQREGSAFGAALLAVEAGGGALPTTGPVRSGAVVQPGPARAAWHDRRYAVYRRLYRALQVALP